MVRKGFLLALAGTALIVAGSVGWSWYEGSHGGAAARRAGAADAQQRLRAIDELERLHSGLAQGTLIRLTDDPDADVALEAIRALGLQADRRSEGRLTQILRGPAGGPRRGAAAAALGNLAGGDRAGRLALLCDVLEHEADAEVRAGAALGLSRLAERGALPHLLQALRDPDPRVRAWALAGLHSVVTIRFDFQPALPPAQQAANITVIEQYLRERGLL